MAFPPTIPTSFVPHPSGSARPYHADFRGAFPVAAYGILAIVFAAAIAVFVYGRILDGELAAKNAALAKAEASIDPATVTAFVRLHNRLASGLKLLDGHPLLSSFFATVEKIQPSTTRFSGLSLALDQNGMAKVTGGGIAKSFNALAAASDAFAKDGRIKEAIFSNISVNKDHSVTFAFSATIDPTLIAFTPAALPQAAIPPTTIPTGTGAAPTTP